ncbi:MAG: class I tRNA ligase family protein [Nitrospiraceae bacterium]
MSAVYLDILKDRLYTFRADSPLRRGSQTVLYDIVVALAKLMAPILSFTAEEIWRTFPNAVRVQAGEPSVHLASFPETDPRWADAKLAQRWERLLRVRESVQGSLELVRSEKRIGSSLDADVTVYAAPDLHALLKEFKQELPSILIVSQVELREDRDSSSGLGLLVKVSPASGKKCERCWNYRPAVGTYPDHPTLCDRCVEAVQ